MERPSKQSLLKRAVAALSSSTNGIQQANVLPSSPESHNAASIERSVSCPPVTAAVARIAVSLPESEASKLDQVSDSWRQSLRWSLESSQGTQSQSSLSLSQPPRSASTAPTSVQHQQRISAPVRPSLAIPSFSFLQSQGWDDSQESEDNEMYLHLREVVEARRDGDEVKSTAAYKTISTRLRALSMLSPERAEILGESGCAFFWRAKRATAAGDYEEGHSLAKQAIVYLNTALKIQEKSTINSYLYLRLGQCNELLGPDRYDNALYAYAQGVSTATRDGAISKKIYMAKVRLLEAIGETSRAWEALQVMTTIWAGDDTLQIRLAKVLLAFKPPTIANVRSALCCVDEAILLDPDNPEYAKVGESLQRLLEDMSRPVNHVLGGRAPIRQHTPSDTDYGEITPPSKTMFEGTNSGPSFWQVLRSKSPSLRPRSGASTVSSQRQRLQQTSPAIAAPVPEHLPAPTFRPRTTSPLAALSGPVSADLLNARPRSANGQRGCDQQFLALQDNVSLHTQVLTDQVARMNHTESSIDTIMTRLAALEIGQSVQTQPFASTSSQEARPMLGRRATRTSAPSLTRSMSVPPSIRPFQLENPSQEELLERSVMLYGVWAMEKMLAKSPAPE